MSTAITHWCCECEAPIEEVDPIMVSEDGALCYMCAEFLTTGCDPEGIQVPDPTALVAVFEARLAAS